MNVPQVSFFAPKRGARRHALQSEGQHRVRRLAASLAAVVLVVSLVVVSWALDRQHLEPHFSPLRTWRHGRR